MSRSVKLDTESLRERQARAQEADRISHDDPGGGQMSDIEWAVFRASDGDSGAPVEGFRYLTREAAQKSIDKGYTQPEFWEPRGRIVGPWTKGAPNA